MAYYLAGLGSLLELMLLDDLVTLPSTVAFTADSKSESVSELSTGMLAMSVDAKMT